jgi:ubiquinol-cytochrome c reductase cytochrome b subunit
LGVILLLLSIFILLLLVIIPCSETPTKFDMPYRIFFFLFVLNFFFLMWLGGQPVTSIYVILAQISTFFYFFYFIAIIPSLYIIEKKFYKTYIYDIKI